MLSQVRAQRSCALFLPVLIAIFVLPAQADKPPADKSQTSDKKKEEKLPLKPTRKVEFSTDEGTWLSLDVSPDGKTIIFDLLGDLYTIPFAGGEAKKITTGMGFNNQPRYSPDGNFIAFVSDRGGAENVWISKPDGAEAKQLSQDEQVEFATPTWTPDSQYVIAARESQFPVLTFELWMYHVKGGAGVQITKGRAKPDASPRDWNHSIGASASRDGRYLYYATRGGFFDKVYNVSFPLSQIARRDRITGEEDVVTDSPGSAFSPVISPDGNKLVYGTRYETETGLRIRDMKSAEEHWLKYPVQRDDQESLFTRDFLPSYAFTPDSKEVIATWGGKIHRVNVESGEEHEIPFTAKVARDLGPDLNLSMNVEWARVSPGYFSTLKMPLLAGREIDQSDRMGTHKVAVVNESFAHRYFGRAQDALGHYFCSGAGDVTPDIEIVGVVKDARHTTVRESVRRTVFTPYMQDPGLDPVYRFGLTFYVRTRQDAELAKLTIGAAMHALDSSLVLNQFRTMKEQVDDNLSDERVIAVLATSFGVLAALLSAIGIYGVLAYSTAQRTREIGIRVAMGAARFEVIKVVVSEVVRLAAIGLSIGLPLCFLLARFVRGELYGISIYDPVTLVAVCAIIATTALASAALPAWRAIKIDPMIALRNE